MATKADFNGEEWSTVVEAPLLAGMRVVSAERGGTIRESLAIGRIYADARKGQGESEFLDALVASPPALDPQTLQPGADIKTVVADRLREASRLVREKGPPRSARPTSGSSCRSRGLRPKPTRKGASSGLAASRSVTRSRQRSTKSRLSSATPPADIESARTTKRRPGVCPGLL